MIARPGTLIPHSEGFFFFWASEIKSRGNGAEG